jgi:hypothetical protein
MTDLWLDHLVVTTRFDLPRAAEIFRSLGFTLSPMGRHGLGSINHVILFEGSYLEVIGVPTDGGLQRQEVLEAPVGIDGLVYGMADADVLHAALVAAGLPVGPVQPLSRPVERNGVSREAGFRTVRSLPGSFEAGRVYYCQQLTPELVWLPEFMTHANGAFAQSRLTMVAEDPAAEAAHLAPWADASTPGFEVQFVSKQAYRETYADLACDDLGRRSFFGAIHLTTRDLDAVIRSLPSAGDAVRHQALTDGLAVRIVDFNCLLVFHPA